MKRTLKQHIGQAGWEKLHDIRRTVFFLTYREHKRLRTQLKHTPIGLTYLRIWWSCERQRLLLHNLRTPSTTYTNTRFGP